MIKYIYSKSLSLLKKVFSNKSEIRYPADFIESRLMSNLSRADLKYARKQYDSHIAHINSPQRIGTQFNR